MDELIRKQTVLNMIDDVQFGNITQKLSQLYEAVRNYPSVDAVEVVRCEGCKHASPNGKYGCKSYHYKLYECHEMGADDFCSYGKRKSNETD